jgi:hypothetical protein
MTVAYEFDKVVRKAFYFSKPFFMTLIPIMVKGLMATGILSQVSS